MSRIQFQITKGWVIDEIKLALGSQLLKVSDAHRRIQFPILSAFGTCLKFFIFNSLKIR